MHEGPMPTTPRTARTSRRGGGPCLLAAAALACGLAVAAGQAEAGQRIVNGVDTQDFPTTGALLYSGGSPITTSNAQTQCTGTLIGCQTFLTAAHCVDDTNPASYWVYLQHYGIAAVSAVVAHPQYDPNLSGRDIAVLKLAAPVTGIEPTPYNSTHDLDAMGVGLAGTIAGFGQTSGTGNDYGIKRTGDVVTADCDTGATNGEGNDKLVCWNFESPVGPAGDDSNTCNGDSGGPLFMDFGAGPEVVGVTSAGSSADCLALDHSWDASLYYNAAWVAGELGADSTSSCSLPPVGDVDVNVFTDAGTLSAGNPDDYFEVNLSGTPTAVRFTLNGTDSGSYNPDLFVKQGAGASPSDFDCAQTGSTVYHACEFGSPAAGTWSMFARRTSGSGQYQLTTTVYGGAPPVCGNDIEEFGEDCDGTDDDACTGLCTGGCSCPAPVCGNDVVESGEQCDGTDNGACPGECQLDCSCFQPCTTGPLYGLRFRSDERRLRYKGYLYDFSSIYADLDPTADDWRFEVTDVGGAVQLLVPASDLGWVRADPVKRRYIWKGDGTLDGLRRVKFLYKEKGPFWRVIVIGKQVPGGDTLNLVNVLDFELGVGGTCHLESW